MTAKCPLVLSAVSMLGSLLLHNTVFYTNNILTQQHYLRTYTVFLQVHAINFLLHCWLQFQDVALTHNVLKTFMDTNNWILYCELQYCSCLRTLPPLQPLKFIRNHTQIFHDTLSSGIWKKNAVVSILESSVLISYSCIQPWMFLATPTCYC